ncbi:hypothetical protein [Gaetbulibacter aestuarii]|uniref:Uncharacterized protein n=1 Tax=Gaetbulibacter aestuarii TaxID=1502358 RepID=A0ABW7N2B9_9FLAO
MGTLRNFGEFRQKELKVYNHTVNNFSRVFDANICGYIPNNSGKIFEIRDYHDIGEAGINYLLSIKEELKFFQRDFYNWKSPESIAEIIDEDVDLVLEYAKKYFVTPEGIPLERAKLGEDGYNINSRREKFSSFQVLRDIQIAKRYELLRKINKL